MLFRHIPHIRSEVGQGLISTIAAAGLIVMAATGVGVSAMNLGKAMRKTELANMAIMLESTLIAEFLNKNNFPDPDVVPTSPNPGLRNGTLTSFTIGAGTPLGPVNVPITADGSQGVTGFLNKNLAPCGGTDFSDTCVLKYEIRLKRLTSSATISTYAFAYQVDVNPGIISMASMGKVDQFNAPIDPGLYRVQNDFTKCNEDEYVFMTGVNRDTGQAFCVKKPLNNRCPDGYLPKGLSYNRSQTNSMDPSDAGVLKLDCTAQSMRSMRCPDNYSLWTFNPQYADPETTGWGATPPGKCIFRTASTAALDGSYPPNPSSPYMSQVQGTFCPPYYAVTNTSAACQLVPNDLKNSTVGKGRCALTGHKDCSRETYTTTNDGGAAYKAWQTCMASSPALPTTCGPAPANPVITYTCQQTQVSANCDGHVTSGGPSCAVVDPWDDGTEYAYGFYDVAPTAMTTASSSGRTINCSFVDTSPTCTAPPLDINGQSWGLKSPKWYGGVQIRGVQCQFQPTAGTPEEVNAIGM